MAKAQDEDSLFGIKSAEDVFHVMRDKEVLKKVLQQGLKEEHKQYKESVAEFLMKMKDRSKVEDLPFYPSR